MAEGKRSLYEHERKFSVLYAEDPDNPVQLELDRPTLQFSPGEVITGRVLLVLKDQIEAKEIVLAFVGTGRTSWAVVQDHRTIDDRHHAQSELYLDEKLRIFGDGSTPKTISPGITEYPFKFPLPASLPSTYIDAYGSVTYVIRALVVLRKAELRGLAAFLINGIFDLNSEPELYHKAELYGTKSPGCCCTKGRVEMTVHFHKRGYIPGEEICWRAELNNDSSRRIKSVTASFIQRAEFRAGGYDKTDTKIMGMLIGGKIPRKKHEKWVASFTVPPHIPPTRLGITDHAPKLIHIEYFVQFRMRICCSRTLVAEIPVTIGTVPLLHRALGHESVSIMKFGDINTNTPSKIF